MRQRIRYVCTLVKVTVPGRKQEPPDNRERHEEIGLGSDDRCHRDPGDRGHEPEQQRRLHEIEQAVAGGGRGHRVL